MYSQKQIEENIYTANLYDQHRQNLLWYQKEMCVAELQDFELCYSVLSP